MGFDRAEQLFGKEKTLRVRLVWDGSTQALILNDTLVAAKSYVKKSIVWESNASFGVGTLHSLNYGVGYYSFFDIFDDLKLFVSAGSAGVGSGGGGGTAVGSGASRGGGASGGGTTGGAGGGAPPPFLQGISITGDYTYTTTCTDTLAEGQSCQITILFKPATEGERNGTFSFVDPFTNQRKSLMLRGTGGRKPIGTVAGSTLIGTEGDDALSLTPGILTVDGMGGRDTLRVQAPPAATTTTRYNSAPKLQPDGSYKVIASGTGYTFTFKNVEIVKFPKGDTWFSPSDVKSALPSPLAWLWNLKTRAESALQNFGSSLASLFAPRPNMAAAVLSLSTDTVTFDPIDVGTSQSKTITITVTNTGSPSQPPPSPPPSPPPPPPTDQNNSNNSSDSTAGDSQPPSSEESHPLPDVTDGDQYRSEEH